MAKVNAPFLKFNQGLISPESLARVDDPRTQLSAEVYTNWLPKTQGSMRIRPGTIFKASSDGNNKAYWIEFVAGADEVALLELTGNKMRVWQGTDAHTLSVLTRPLITGYTDTGTTLDTGTALWQIDNVGGGYAFNSGVKQSLFVATGFPAHPTFSEETGNTNDGNTVSIDATQLGDTGAVAWKSFDGDATTYASQDTGGNWAIKFAYPQRIFAIASTPPSGIVENGIVDLRRVTVEATNDPGGGWTTLISNFDLVDNSFYSYDTRKYWYDTGYVSLHDTGGIPAYSNWRVINADTGAKTAATSDLKFFTESDTGQAYLVSSTFRLNAGARGSIARIWSSQIATTDIGVVHSLRVSVPRGPVTLRMGSATITQDADSLDDDLIAETVLNTGEHNLAFVPKTLQSTLVIQTDDHADRIVGPIVYAASGVVEIETPWDTGDLDNIRYDQSADVVFVDCKGRKPYQIERRGTGDADGLSWSVVENAPAFGPWRPTFAQVNQIRVGGYFGNTSLESDLPFFKPGHVGALFRLTHSGQSGSYRLGVQDAATDSVSVVGINDTGKNDTGSERIAKFTTVATDTGIFGGNIIVERSFEAKDFGFSRAIADNITQGTSYTPTDSGGKMNTKIRDVDDNLTVYYRSRIDVKDTGAGADNTHIIATVTAKSGVKSGVVRATRYYSPTQMECEVISPPSSTDFTSDWEEGAWSGYRGYPSSVAFHEGRLAHAGEANVWLTESDNYNSFDDTIEGSSAPISRTLGSGPVENILNLTSAERLIANTSSSEIVIRSSSFDEILTATNTAARRMSTLGGANIRTIKRNNDIFHVQRSGKNLYRIPPLEGQTAPEPEDLTVLAPDVLSAGVVDVAIQREPDTRIHLVLADGTVAILTYEPTEGMIAWSKWAGDTGTGAFVERAAVLPATGEDAVYYHVRRTINGATMRFLEKWALESESYGDTGLSYLSDCAVAFTADTGDLRDTVLTGISPLAGSTVVVWADDTGQSNAGKDLSPDVSGVQTEYTVDTGDGTVTLNEAVHHAVVGAPYKANWRSTKLAYGAQFGTALAQMKRADKIGLVLYKTHNNGLFFGNDTGELDAMPRVSDKGAVVDTDKIFSDVELVSIPFPGLWDSDSRVYLRAKSPRPATVLAAIPTVNTVEKI